MQNQNQCSKDIPVANAVPINPYMMQQPYMGSPMYQPFFPNPVMAQYMDPNLGKNPNMEQVNLPSGHKSRKPRSEESRDKTRKTIQKKKDEAAKLAENYKNLQEKHATYREKSKVFVAESKEIIKELQAEIEEWKQEHLKAIDRVGKYKMMYSLAKSEACERLGGHCDDFMEVLENAERNSELTEDEDEDESDVVRASDSEEPREDA